jgi:hypothetical protein
MRLVIVASRTRSFEPAIEETSYLIESVTSENVRLKELLPSGVFTPVGIRVLLLN